VAKSAAISGKSQLDTTLSQLDKLSRETKLNHKEIARLSQETGENMAKVRAILDTL
jgi:hypothetical protein